LDIKLFAGLQMGNANNHSLLETAFAVSYLLRKVGQGCFQI